jgi:hypothetical protein
MNALWQGHELRAWLPVQVVGISSMKALTADGVSFAIPIDTAKHVVSQAWP